MHNLNNIEKCTGCSACVDICPKGCILMYEDKNGFRYPYINEDMCIQCHRCTNVCPVNNKPNFIKPADNSRMIAAAWSKSEDTLLKAASGGVFSEIVKSICQMEHCEVWGAAYDKSLHVKHICSHGTEQLDRLCNSKYVISQMDNCYKNILNQLKKGQHVIFSGLPCQVAALRNFLKSTDTTNLLCIDLLCHGAPSQKLFDIYIKEESQHLHSKITAARFRAKMNLFGKWTTRNLELTTERGKKILRLRYQCSYLRAFYSSLMKRASCYRCMFSTEDRTGDLTIGDFWDIKRFRPDLSPAHGVSLVWSNTEKGMACLKNLKNMNIYPITPAQFKQIKTGSPAWLGGSEMPKKREQFLALANDQGMEKAVKKIFPFHIDFLRFCASKIINIFLFKQMEFKKNRKD